MKTVDLGTTAEIAQKVCDILGLQMESTVRIVIEIEPSLPFALLHVQSIGEDKELIGALGNLLKDAFAAGYEKAR